MIEWRRVVQAAAVSAGMTVIGMTATTAIAQDGAPGRPNLSGTWILNRDLSDRLALPDAATERPGRGGPGGGGRPGGPGGGPGGGGPGGFGGGFGGGRPDAPPGGADMPDPKQMKRIAELMEELLTPSPRLIILQRDDSAVTFVDADGHARVYAINGKKEVHQLASGTVQTRSEWARDQLTMSISIERGPGIVETYSIDPKTRQLLIQVKVSEGRGPRLPPRRVVYDPASDR